MQEKGVCTRTDMKTWLSFQLPKPFAGKNSQDVCFTRLGTKKKKKKFFLSYLFFSPW
jgi:hypothetical protein